MGSPLCMPCIEGVCLVHSELERKLEMKKFAGMPRKKRKRTDGDGGSLSRESQQAAQPAA